MPDTSIISPFQFSCQGGLILDRPVFDMPPGTATSLVNFEPSLLGGYRRINGTTLWNTNEVTGSGKVLMSAILGANVVAARGANVMYAATGTGTWTSITAARTNAGRYDHDRFNFAGTEKLIFVDGINAAATWDGSTYVLLNGTNLPTAPSKVAVHKDHIFLLQGNTVTFTAPFNEADGTVANGAGSFTIDSDGTGLRSHREELYIFAKDRIYKLLGSSSSDFTLIPVTRKIGCLNGFTIQEIGGDLVFLGPDGLRTLSLTDRLGDSELATISKNIQPRFNDITDFDLLVATSVRRKSQYRMWYTTTSNPEGAAKGIIAVEKHNHQGKAQQDITGGWEFADIKGTKPSCADSFYVSNDEIVVSGGFDGYVYKQESGNNFNGTAINCEYRTPDNAMGDAGIRKILQRIILHASTEGAVSFDTVAEFDFNSTSTAQPSATTTAITTGNTYGTGIYGTATYGAQQTPFERIIMMGSGFTLAARISSNDDNPPFIIKGMSFEINPGGRR